MLLKKGFQLRTASTQQQALILLNSNNQETHYGHKEQKFEEIAFVEIV